MSWLFWAVLSALFAAATALLAKVGVEHVDPNLATAIRTTVVVIFAWTIAFFFGGFRSGDRLVVDLLLPRPLSGRSLQGSARRQAKRGVRRGAGLAAIR